VPVSYHLTFLHCGSRIATTERVGDAAIAAVEDHLRAEHPDVLPARADVRPLTGL